MADPQVSRRFPRLAAHHSVLVKKLGNEALEEFGLTKTIAVGGCSFISDESVGEDSLLEMLIAVDHQVITVRGRVVYESASAGGRTEIGVEFVQLDPMAAATISRLLEKRD